MDLSLPLATALVPLAACGSLLGFAAWLRPDRRGLVRSAQGLGWSSLLLAGLAWTLRWHAAGHLPIFGTYESSLSLALTVLLLGPALGSRLRAPLGVWPIACLVAAALVAHGRTFDPTVFALTISERSWVVEVHAVLAWTAFAALLANAALAAGRLLRVRADRQRWDRRMAFTLSLGFALHSAMLVSGSWYRFLLFGDLWGFDPIETLGFVAWVAYGALLHMHLFAGWEGRRLAGWCVALFVLLIVSYRAISYYPAWSTYHILDMDLRMHVTGTTP